MPDAQCIKYPIKPGQSEPLINWIAGLERRSDALVEALAEGGVIAEAVFVERTDSADYLLIYTCANDLQKGMKALAKSDQPLVQEFNKLLTESVELENAIPLKLVYRTP